MKSKLRVIEGGAEPRKPAQPLSAFADAQALKRQTAEKWAALTAHLTPRKRKGKSRTATETEPRRFRQLDETWALRLLAHSDTPPWMRLLIVLLAEADYHRQIKITRAIEQQARVTRYYKERALRHLEQLGLITVEWRGRGRAPIATPLHLTGRPARR